jgi:stage II sporulation protein D
MERWTTAERLRRAGRWAAAELRTRPVRAAACAVVALALGVGVWSCQTAPAPVPSRSPTAALPAEPEVRVRIRAGVPAVKLSGFAEFALRRVPDGPVVVPGPLTLEASAEGCRITDGKGQARTFAGTAGVDVAGVGPGAAGDQKIRVDGMSYPGRIRILPRAGVTSMAAGSALQSPRLDVVEIVPMETYLVGVVGAELYKDWALGAFQVQAVCARTYALHERERSVAAGRDYDLESTTTDQAYLGGMHLPVAIKGVAETRGVVLSWQGRLLRAYYSSTCGGRTAAAANIWPTGKGYEFNLAGPIQAHHREAMCQASSRYRWQQTRERAQLSKQIREWGRANGSPVAKMGTLAAVAVDSANIDGRPIRYLLTDTQRNTFPIECEQLRSACNVNVAGYPEIGRETRVSSSDLEVEIRGEKVTIRGRGFGHGVGMCQFCTQAMALRGDKWQDMVMRFYPGAKLERAY